MSMAVTDLIQKNKQRLTAEKAHLEKLLSRVADKDAAGRDFHAKYPDFGSDAESNAAEVEAYQVNIAEGYDLEERLRAVEEALKKIADGTYGICSVGGEKIPDARLEAVPEAQTCVKHGQN